MQLSLFVQFVHYVSKYGQLLGYMRKKSEKSFEIQVKANPLPVFVDEIELPDVFVSGSEYIFPQYYANDYSGENMVRKETYAEITDSDGMTLVHAGDTFTPTVEKNGETVKGNGKYIDCTIFDCAEDKAAKSFANTLSQLNLTA